MNEPIPTDGEQLRNVPETGERLRVSRATVYRLMSSGQLKPVRIGRCVRIPQSEIDAYIDRLKVSA